MDQKLKLDLERYYLVHQSEIDKIDALIGALNLAITEILEWRPVRREPFRPTPAQTTYDDEIGKITYREDWTDFS